MPRGVALRENGESAKGNSDPDVTANAEMFWSDSLSTYTWLPSGVTATTVGLLPVGTGLPTTGTLLSLVVSMMSRLLPLTFATYTRSPLAAMPSGLMPVEVEDRNAGALPLMLNVANVLAPSQAT